MIWNIILFFPLNLDFLCRNSDWKAFHRIDRDDPYSNRRSPDAHPSWNEHQLLNSPTIRLWHKIKQTMEISLDLHLTMETVKVDGIFQPNPHPIFSTQVRVAWWKKV